MKILILCLLSITCIGQTKRLVEISKEYVTKEITISHGLVYKYNIGTQNDTARYFNGNGKQYKATISFQEIGLTPVDPPSNLYDTIDSLPSHQIVYNGTWSYATVGGHYKNTISYSSIPNNYIEISSLVGKRINLFFERKRTHGMAEIILNGVPQVPLIDLYTSTQPESKKQLLYSAELKPGINTIRIRVTGAKNPASSFQWVVFDFATVEK